MKCSWIIIWCFVFSLVAFVLTLVDFFLNITTCLQDISKCLGPTELHAHVGLTEYEIIEKYGYKYEQHYVTTEDGYILEICRILSAGSIKNTSTFNIFPNLMARTPGEPVLLMPGFVLGAHSYVSHDPENSLAFLLTNHGYDVFLANTRGTSRSRRHVTLDADENPKDFFDWSWHEIGVFDQPAMIDYILHLTGFQKISYIGYSQGGTSLLVMTSTRPEYNSKLKIALTLGALGTMRYTPNLNLMKLVTFEKTLQEISETMEIYDVLKYSPSFLDVAKVLIDKNYGLRNVFIKCMNTVSIAMSYNLNLDLVPVYATSAPSGASVKQILHYMQSIENGDFRMYNYANKSRNIEKYGSDVPPRYNLSAVTSPVVMYYSNDDFFVQGRDVMLMANEMPNATPKEIKVKKFSHVHYIWSKDVTNILFKDVLLRLRV